MINGRSVAVIIPALNEEMSIGIVLDELATSFTRIVVVDNGSTDATVAIAQSKGAIVVHEPRRGYGAACLLGIAELAKDPPDVVLFCDADRSDHPDDAYAVAELVCNGRAEMCIGSRVLGERERGALTPQQIFGNWLATTLIRLRWGTRYTDLGPLRALTWSLLTQMAMEDVTWGWTVEMQIKAARDKSSVVEIPVRYRRRIGTSKISGTIMGSIRAGTKILHTIAHYALR
ncbi:MAG: glycosyltransferase family 2 protein [Candidatus Kapabacteria bacterium]|nr:glycosyltransferase family 2 protein [Candidatus Kapabacteria bacterium]